MQDHPTHTLSAAPAVHATTTLPATAGGIARAAALLRAGGLVAFATETVYGLGADACNDVAVAGVFAAKGRPDFNPLIVHVPDLAAARQVAAFNDDAERLAAAFWPGPLTLVLPLRPEAGVSRLVTAGLATVAVRVPAHPLALALLRAFAGPLAAPSANVSGRVSPTRAAHVHDGLAGRIAAVLDGGTCAVGLESTIVALTGPAMLLRPGGLPVEALEACLGTGMLHSRPGDAPTAPGQLASHYAPRAALRLNADGPRSTEVWLGFGPQAQASDLNLSPAGDLAEAAAGLFDALRRIDALAGPSRSIAVSPIPAHGLGRAINDRLTRAAAPRPDVG